MSDTKWAEIAHYYMHTHVNQVFSLWWVKVPNDETVYTAVPMLRHRDDITEADAMALWKSVANRVDFDDSVYAAYGSPLVIYRSKFKALQPEEFHCAIQLGYDVFGLIESGQAIRKEAGNG